MSTLSKQLEHERNIQERRAGVVNALHLLAEACAEGAKIKAALTTSAAAFALESGMRPAAGDVIAQVCGDSLLPRDAFDAMHKPGTPEAGRATQAVNQGTFIADLLISALGASD